MCRGLIPEWLERVCGYFTSHFMHFVEFGWGLLVSSLGLRRHPFRPCRTVAQDNHYCYVCHYYSVMFRLWIRLFGPKRNVWRITACTFYVDQFMVVLVLNEVHVKMFHIFWMKSTCSFHILHERYLQERNLWNERSGSLDWKYLNIHSKQNKAVLQWSIIHLISYINTASSYCVWVHSCSQKC